MEINDFTEPASDLIATAKAAGFDISESGVARWHRIGLLPKPRIQPLGRGKGTRSVYPQGTTQQLLVLCRLHEETRSLSIVGWQLWCRGFRVGDTYWRPVFDDAVSFWDDFRGQVAKTFYPNGSNAIAEDALRLLAINGAKTTNSIFGQIRKRVRTRQRSAKDKLAGIKAEDYRAHANADFRYLMQAIIDIFLGRFRAWPGAEHNIDNSAEKRILERALGVHRASVNQIPSAGPLLIGSVAPVLAQLSELCRTPMAKYRQLARDEDIFGARNEWFRLLTLFDSLGAILESIFGKHAFAFGNAGRFLYGLEPRSQALQILLWHVFRNKFADTDRIAAILAFEPVVSGAAKTSKQLHDLADNIPAIRNLVQPKRIRGAIRNPRKMKSLGLELRELIKTERQSN